MYLLYNIYIFNIRFSTKNIKFVNTYIITFSTNQLENPIKYIDLNIIEISFFCDIRFTAQLSRKISHFFYVSGRRLLLRLLILLIFL